MIRSAASRIGALTATVLLMSGCGVGSPPAYTELSATQTSADDVPDGYAHDDDVDGDTIRFVGSHENVDYFLAQITNDEMRDGVCILVVPEDSPKDGYRACGGGTGEITVGAAGHRSARYLPPGAPEIDGHDDWVRLSDNLLLMG